MMAHLELDRFGRVLIPKALREALSLQAGEQLEVELKDGALHLRPVQRPAQLIEHAGRLILASEGKITGDPVEEFRDARTEEVLSRW